MAANPVIPWAALLAIALAPLPAAGRQPGGVAGGEMERREALLRLEADQRAYRRGLGALDAAERAALARRLADQRRGLRFLHQHRGAGGTPPPASPGGPVTPPPRGLERQRQQRAEELGQRIQRRSWPYGKSGR